MSPLDHCDVILGALISSFIYAEYAKFDKKKTDVSGKWKTANFAGIARYQGGLGNLR